ncbi:MAG: sensor histidine kinase [Azonexus sp.]
MSEPLQQLCADLGARSAQQLSPLEAGQYPAEWEPAVIQINRLLADVAHSLRVHQRFMAEAAHELRTPLAAIQLYADIVSIETDPEISRLAMRNLQEGVARSTRLCQQLLAHGRLEARLGQNAPWTMVDLADLARQAVLAHDDSAARQGIDLGLLAPASHLLPGDAEALTLLLNNLIGNALQHAPRDSMVDVRIEAHGAKVRLSVSDHGPGIPESEWPHAFQPFWTLPGGKTGHGLGLAIVHDAVRLHEGEIRLAQTPGGGLTVHIDLPSPPVPCG